MPPTHAQVELLQAIAHGLSLKSHRDLEGRKEYRLLGHPLADQGPPGAVETNLIFISAGRARG
jgi:hypothetical protein